MDLLRLLSSAGQSDSDEDSNDKTKRIFYNLEKMAALKIKDNLPKRIKHLNMAIRHLEEGPAHGFQNSKDQSLMEMKRCLELLHRVGMTSNRSDLQAVINDWGMFYKAKQLKSTRLCNKTLKAAIMYQDISIMMSEIPVTPAPAADTDTGNNDTDTGDNDTIEKTD